MKYSYLHSSTRPGLVKCTSIIKVDSRISAYVIDRQAKVPTAGIRCYYNDGVVIRFGLVALVFHLTAHPSYGTSTVFHWNNTAIYSM